MLRTRALFNEYFCTSIANIETDETQNQNGAGLIGGGSGNGLLGPPTSYIDPDLLSDCLKQGSDELKKRKLLEEDLYQIFQTRKNTPSFYHQLATPQTLEALHMSDSAVVGEETLKCLRKNDVKLDQIEASDLSSLKKAWPHCRSHQWPFWAVADLDCGKYGSKYRSLDGSCNNLRNPLWGTSFRPFRRILSAEYDDGFSTPRNTSVHHTGGELPPGRQVSICMQNATDQWTEPKLSLLFVEFAQFLDQDLSSIAASKGESDSYHFDICSLAYPILCWAY